MFHVLLVCASKAEEAPLIVDRYIKACAQPVDQQILSKETEMWYGIEKAIDQSLAPKIKGNILIKFSWTFFFPIL